MYLYSLSVIFKISMYGWSSFNAKMTLIGLFYLLIQSRDWSLYEVRVYIFIEYNLAIFTLIVVSITSLYHF